MKKKFSSWEKVCELREFKALRSLPTHINVISLLEAFLITQARELYFVFEFQVLEGLYHIHSNGIFHCDMKPENILVSTRRRNLSESKDNSMCSNNGRSSLEFIDDDDVEFIIKIGDFGLARETKSKPPYTEYVSTRWYRAPEVLLRSNVYSSPIDIWAVGTIIAELYTLKPLFPGQSEIDQLCKISEVLGSPCFRPEVTGQVIENDELGGGEWKEGIKLAKTLGFTFPQIRPQPLSKIFPPTTPPNFLQFLAYLLRFDPRQRLSALDALKHPYFVESNLIFVPALPSAMEDLKTNNNSVTTSNNNKGTDKKRKNDNFLPFRKGGNLVVGEKKSTNRYSWSKEGQNQDVIDDIVNLSNLPPLDIEAANNLRHEEFILPTIRAISPFGPEEPGISLDSYFEDLLHENEIIIDKNRSSGGEKQQNFLNNEFVSLENMEKNNSSSIHKRNRTRNDSRIASSSAMPRSCRSSRDFMKVHRRYSSLSATTRGDISSLSSSFDFHDHHRHHSKKSSVASSQDHTRNDSGFSTNSNNNNDGDESQPVTAVENDTMTPLPYINKHYGQHLKTCQQMYQQSENTIQESLFENSLIEENLGTLKCDDELAIKENCEADALETFESSNQEKQQSKSLLLEHIQASNNGNSFLSNLKAATGMKNITKKRSFIFEAATKNKSLFSSKESPSNGDEKKEKRGHSSNGLFAALGAKISGSKNLI
ncbi:3160_t:CDS:10 [Entrophospora sp. SA101]|nr:3160_t:CDS:10 [Entrophospora sp. SA101]